MNTRVVLLPIDVFVFDVGDLHVNERAEREKGSYKRSEIRDVGLLESMCHGGALLKFNAKSVKNQQKIRFLAYLSQIIESFETMVRRLSRRVNITYWSLLLGGIGLIALAFISPRAIGQWIGLTGFTSFFFSSGVAAAVAASQNLQSNFIRVTKKVSVIISLITLALAGLTLFIGGTEAGIYGVQVIGVYYILFAMPAWIQIGLGLWIGSFFTTSEKILAPLIKGDSQTES